MTNSLPQSKLNLPVIILAGGKSERLRINNKLKWQLPFGEQSLLTYIIQKIQQQSATVIINAPKDHDEELREFGLPLIYDLYGDFLGPLAGLQTALQWAQDNHKPMIATIACDTPFFPDNLLSALTRTYQQQQQQHHHQQPKAIVARHQGYQHPTFGLWPVELLSPLTKTLAADGCRSMMLWTSAVAEHADFDSDLSDQKPHFFHNINSLEDYRQALHYLD